MIAILLDAPGEIEATMITIILQPVEKIFRKIAAMLVWLSIEKKETGLYAGPGKFKLLSEN